MVTCSLLRNSSRTLSTRIQNLPSAAFPQIIFAVCYQEYAMYFKRCAVEYEEQFFQLGLDGFC